MNSANKAEGCSGRNKMRGVTADILSLKKREKSREYIAEAVAHFSALLGDDRISRSTSLRRSVYRRILVERSHTVLLRRALWGRR